MTRQRRRLVLPAGWGRLVLIAGWLLLQATPARAALPCPAALPNGLPVLQRIGPQLWQVPSTVAPPDAANPTGASSGLAVVADGRRLWLVGSGPTPAFGAALACALHRATGRAVTDVINTRPHAELALGNAAFPQARVWALSDVAHTMRRHCPQCLARLKARLGVEGDSLQLAAIRLPTHRVDRGTAAAGRLGPFRWWALPRAPGARVLVLQHRNTGVVLAQGLVWVEGVPDLRETTLAAMRPSLARLHVLAQGHAVLGEAGGFGSQADVSSHLLYLDTMHSAVSDAVQRGDVEGVATAELGMAAFAARAGYAWLHPLNLQRAWRELEAAAFAK